MNTPTPPFNLPATTPELALRLSLILAGLVALVARRFLRMPRLVGLTIALCSRLGRAAWRFARMMTRKTAVRAPRVRAGLVARVRARAVGLPSGRGWLVRELGWEAAGYGSQLQALLDDPAMQAVLVAMPGAGRIFRPLCRMLGVPGPVTVVAAVADVVVEARVASPVWPRVAGLVLPGIVGDFGSFATSC